MEKPKKSKLNQSLYNGELDKRMVEKARHKMQLNAYQDILSKLVQREPYVDYETEVLPYLKDEWAYIFKNYMIAPNGEFQEEIAKDIGYTIGGVSKAIGYIFNLIDTIIEKKKSINDFVKNCGGQEELKDFELCLSQKEKYLLNEVILSIDPNATTKYSHKFNCLNVTQSTQVLMTKLDIFKKRKKECLNFIEENGGEEFLINEFGATLSDDYFEVLIKFMLDYHYIYKPLEDYNYYQFIKNSQIAIKKELQKYHERKKEVDTLIENAGGAEKVLNEIYLPLNETYKKIFEERILAYKQTSLDELSKEFGVSQPVIIKKEYRLREQISNLIASNSKNLK